MDLVTQIRRDEGEKLSVYEDSLGWWTIGVGICVDSRKGCGLLPEESEFILKNRLDIARLELDKVYPWFRTMNEPRQAALINMYHQMGPNGLQGFQKMLGALRDQRWPDAAYQALDSTWAKVQTPARARRMARQFETGEWQ